MEQIDHGPQWTEFADSLRSLRLAKWTLWTVAVLCIVLQLASFAMVDFGGVLGKARMMEPADGRTGTDVDWPAARLPATAQARGDGASPSVRMPPGSAQWAEILYYLLPATKFFAMVAAMLLVLIVLLGVNLGIASRWLGMSDMISAFFWSLLLLAVLVPWQQVLGGRFTAGTLFNLTELQRWRADNNTTGDYILYYARFIAYPVVGLAMALAVHLKFTRALRMMAGIAPVRVPADMTSKPGSPQPAA